MDNQVELKIRDRNKIIFEGEVSTISGVNEKGKFDILPSHANFIAVIQDKIIVRRKNKKDEVYPVGEEAIMRVVSNKVYVYLGI